MSTQAMAGVMSSPDEDKPMAAQVEEGYGTMASRRHVVVDKAVCNCADIRGREESELERRVRGLKQACRLTGAQCGEGQVPTAEARLLCVGVRWARKVPWCSAVPRPRTRARCYRRSNGRDTWWRYVHWTSSKKHPI